MTSSLSDRIRDRLKDAMTSRKISQTKLAKLLEKFTTAAWTQKDVSRILNGEVKLKVDDLERIAGVLGLSLVDLVREPGRDFVADLRPSEMQVLERLRLKPDYVDAVLHVLRVAEPTVPPVKGRYRPVSKAEFWAPEAPPKR